VLRETRRNFPHLFSGEKLRGGKILHGKGLSQLVLKRAWPWKSIGIWSNIIRFAPYKAYYVRERILFLVHAHLA
jgi:hypothetical protein